MTGQIVVERSMVTVVSIVECGGQLLTLEAQVIIVEVLVVGIVDVVN